jgi:acetyl esterase/lipase
MTSRLNATLVVLGLLIVPTVWNGAKNDSVVAQVAGTPTVPSPTFGDLDYAPPEPATSVGHKLDLYLPLPGKTPFPIVIWTAGSAWMGDTGKRQAEIVAAQLLPRGIAVAGVSVRSSSQAVFPAQVHDIKAALRWVRANATKYSLDPNRVGIMGSSSGGWSAAMAASTGNLSHLEGTVGVTGHSSAVQAAVAFYPQPTSYQWMPGRSGSARQAPENSGSKRDIVTTTRRHRSPDSLDARFRGALARPGRPIRQRTSALAQRR